MKNTIKVTIPFSFRGLEHTPSSIIDLDVFILGDQTLDNVFQLVANENKIDNYSYQYEVLESSPKIFSDPTGIACDFLSKDGFNLKAFKEQRNENNDLQTLNTIANEFLNIGNLEDYPEIRQALMAAYETGKNAS